MNRPARGLLAATASALAAVLLTAFPASVSAASAVSAASQGTAPAPAAGTETVAVTPSTATQDDGFHGTGSGFTPSSTVTITVQQPDGAAYAGSFTHTHTTDASGAFTWGWVWTRGDELGTYTYTATDQTGVSASTTFTITPSTGPPTPESGSSLMFDASSAPSLEVMHAWLQSPYRSVGVYVPVDPAADDRHDKTQANLTASWVATVGGEGFHVVPIYVGLQAPTQCSTCHFHLMSTDAATAHLQGEQAAGDAAHAVAALGVPASTPVFYDMEGYSAGASAEVTAYLDGWVTGLHAAGRLAGVYGSQKSTMADLSAHLDDAAYHEPDDVWVATDNRRATTTGFSYPPDGTFTGRRMNQFHLDVDRTYGGDMLAVDETAINDTVLTATPPRAAPLHVAATRLPAATDGSRLHLGWGGTEQGSYVASYDVRVESGTYRRRLSSWTYPTHLQATTTTAATVSLAAGATWCYEVRARDAAGRVSAWLPRSCTTRPLDDRALRAAHATRLRHRGAYAGTLTRLASPAARLTLPGVATDRVGLVLSGRSNGPLTVTLGTRTVGRVRSSGNRRTAVVWLSLPRETTGSLVVRSTSSRPTLLDGVLLRAG